MLIVFQTEEMIEGFGYQNGSDYSGHVYMCTGNEIPGPPAAEGLSLISLWLLQAV